MCVSVTNVTGWSTWVCRYCKLYLILCCYAHESVSTFIWRSSCPSLFFADMNMKTDTRDETTLTHSIRQFIHYKQDRSQLKLQKLWFVTERCPFRISHVIPTTKTEAYRGFPPSLQVNAGALKSNYVTITFNTAFSRSRFIKWQLHVSTPKCHLQGFQ